VNGLPDPAAARARHAEGASSNVAVATHDLTMVPAEAAALIAATAARLPRWRHEGTRGEVIWLTHRTRLFRFVDDIHVIAEPGPAGTRLLLRSASRVGKSDLGQNARNLQELLAALDAAARNPEP
jgi:uncharacterized protein (DUF1499 family)